MMEKLRAIFTSSKKTNKVVPDRSCAYLTKTSSSTFELPKNDESEGKSAKNQTIENQKLAFSKKKEEKKIETREVETKNEGKNHGTLFIQKEDTNNAKIENKEKVTEEKTKEDSGDLGEKKEEKKEEGVSFLDVARKFGSILWKILISFVDPEYKFSRVWAIVTFLAFVYNSLVIPLRFSFLDWNWTWYWFPSDTLADSIYFLDILGNFFTPYEDGTVKKTKFKDTMRRYLGLWFWIDFAAFLPLDWIYFLINSEYPNIAFCFFRLNKLLRIIRLNVYADVLGKILEKYGTLVRFARFVFIVLFLSHFVTCIWYLVYLNTLDVGGDALEWLSAPEYLHDPYEDLFFIYLSGQYQVAVILSGFSGTLPVTVYQVIFNLTFSFVGIAVYMTVLGIVRSYIINADSAASSFQKKMDAINDYLTYRGISKPLQKKVKNYYTYIWKSRQGLDENKLLADLPDFLKVDVNLHLNRDIIAKVPFFQNVDKIFIGEMVKVLKPRVSLPGSSIVRVGETGAEMFFISKGTVEVIVGDPPVVVATFKDGDFFGEVALVFAKPRTATVRAVTYCDLFVFTKSDFDLILEQYSEEAKVILEEAKRRFMAISSSSDEKEKIKKEENDGEDEKGNQDNDDGKKGET